MSQEPQFTFPVKSRLEVPRDPVDVQMQYPSAPPSPFPYAFGHSRIRTDSLCSMKSNRDITAANLQPRKNIRTEDQKIQDQKKESRERLSNKDLDKSQLRMFDMIYFNPLGNPMKQRSPNKSNMKPKNSDSKVQELPAEVLTPSPAIAVPQLRLNDHGEMVLDETSLVIESEQQKQNRNALAASNVVYDDDLSGNYGYYKRQQRTKEWPQEETVKFYRCLNTVGTDFSLMLNLFPNRSRRDLKLKFKKEEKNNPQLIDKALLKHSTFDLDELKKDFDKEEEERRKATDTKSSSEVKEIVKRKILKKQEATLKAQSGTKVEKVLRDGASVMNKVDHVSPQEVKENLNVTSSFVPSELETDRPKKLKVEDGATSVMAIYSAEATFKPVKRPRQSKTSVPGGTTQPLAKKPRKSSSAATKKAAEAANVKEEVFNSNPAIVQKCEPAPISSLANVVTVSSIIETSFEVPSIETPTHFDHDHKRDTNSIPGESTAITAIAIETVGSDTMTQSPELPCEMELPTPEVQIPDIQTLEVEAPPPIESEVEKEESAAANEAIKIQPPDSDTTNTSVIGSQAISDPDKTSAAAKKPKTRRGKHKPKLVTRLKLDANGDMIMDESANAATENTSNTEANVKELLNTCSTVQVPKEKEPFEQLAQDADELACVDENLNESSDGLDSEMTFLNNLDLEKLVLVQAKRDGEEVFEIHEINPLTQEISDVPLDLPARYFDLIISVMTS